MTGDCSNANGDFRFPYFLRGGRPAGGAQPSTRRRARFSGTPTAPGTWTVTYTAEDADVAASADRNPLTVDPSDTAKQTFTIQVGNQPRIERIRIVSQPTYDADNNGENDTYARQDRILIDVEFNEPVTVAGDGAPAPRPGDGRRDDAPGQTEQQPPDR